MSEDNEVIMVSCGGVQGKLIMSEFICPGIHQRCIEVDGVLMTPKAFCVIGEKERLKDWKNAIRINGKSIRRRMYARDIDFHKHEELCTGRCMSRNYGPSKFDSTSSMLHTSSKDDSSNDFPTLLPIKNNPDDPAYTFLREVSLDGANETSDSLDDANESSDKVLLGQIVFPNLQTLEQRSSMPVLKQESVKREIGSHGNSDSMRPGQVAFPNQSLLVHRSSMPILKQESVKRDICSDEVENFYESLNGCNLLNGSNLLRDLENSNPGSSKNRRKSKTPQRISNNTAVLQSILASPPLPAMEPLDDSQVSLQKVDISNGAIKTSSKKNRKNGSINTDKESEIIKIVSEFPDADSLFEDSVAFWQGVQAVGVLDSVIRDMKQTLDNIKNDMQRATIMDSDAKRLSAVVKELGLVTKLKWRLANHKSNAQSEEDKLRKEIEALKMKVALSEQKKSELKRKSEYFDNLLPTQKKPMRRSRVADDISSISNSNDINDES